MTDSWLPVSDMPPLRWFRTRRDGETGENVCMWVDAGNGEREYWDKDGCWSEGAV